VVDEPRSLPPVATAPVARAAELTADGEVAAEDAATTAATAATAAAIIEAAQAVEPLVAPSAGEPYLVVDKLRIGVPRDGGELRIVDEVNVTLEAGASLGIVGESGSGKTMLCRSFIGTLPRYGVEITGGRLVIAGGDMTRASEHDWRRIRGRAIGYVPQSSLAGLNPVLTVETQLLEALHIGQRALTRTQARAEARRLLDLVRIPRAGSVLGERSHQLSGGMRQRVMIAAALALAPPLLVLDEPTTALDVTVQYEILQLIRALRDEFKMGLILVSHDLAVVEFLCERIMTMYAGATVEIGPAAGMRSRPRHPYTGALLHSRLGLAERGVDLVAIPGESPAVGSWPVGSRFWPRCPYAIDECKVGEQPGLRLVGGHWTSCIRAEDVT
jgi:oligopeptide/dipeptide ABC transporter ATP-binding protein